MTRGPARPPVKVPRAVETEQALLGALLCDGQAISLLPGSFGAQHFSEPFHARLYVRIALAAERGQVFDMFVGGGAFQGDVAFEELGGTAYLGLLMEQAPPSANVGAYARELMSIWVRAELAKLSDEIAEQANDASISAEELLSGVERAVSVLHTPDSSVQLTGADEAMDSVLDYIDNPDKHSAGILTGLGPLDGQLGPWLPGDLIVIGGRPGMGKSALAAIIDQNVACARSGVIEIHAEMSVDQVWRRRLTAMAYSIYAGRAPGYSSIRKRTISFDEREMLTAAREALRGIPLKAVKRTGMTLGRLRSLVTRQRAEWDRAGIPLGLVTIDHVGLIKSDRNHRSRVDEQTEISNGLKELADELKVPILALAQLSRQSESRDDKRPVLSDLRDSGSWEQDADVVIGTYRDAYYAVREKEPAQNTTKGQCDWADWDSRCRSKTIELLLLKVREGETGTAKIWADMRTNTILGEAPADDFFGGR